MGVTGNDNTGVRVDGLAGTATLAAGSGALSVTGLGGGAAGAVGNSDGVRVTNAVTNSGGDYTAVGTALNSVETNGSDNDGVSYTNVSGTIGDGNVSITGTAPGLLAVGATDSNRGVEFDTVTLTSSVTGAGAKNVTIIGTGGAAATGGENDGVFMTASTVTLAAGSGTLSISGASGTGTGGNSDGVEITNASVVQTSATGAVFITGQSNATGGNGNTGISVDESSTVKATNAAATATVTLTGVGAALGGTDNHGVWVSEVTAGADSTVESNGGALTVRGTAGGNGSYNVGVNVQNSTLKSAGAATTVSGIGGSGTDDNTGVIVFGNTALVQGAGSGIQITGSTTALAAGTASRGVVIAGAADVLATAGTIHITGGGATNAQGGVNYGVQLQDAGTSVIATAGSVGITGTAGGQTAVAAGSNNIGVFASDATITAGAGSLNVTGFGGSGANDNDGVRVFTSTLSATTGATLAGTALQNATLANALTGGTNNGVYLSASQVSTSGGNLEISGIAGDSTAQVSDNMGVRVELGSVITNSSTSAADRILITGLGAAGATGTGNRGVLVDSSTVQATGAAFVSVQGTARSGTDTNRGVEISAATVSSNTGTIGITGQGAGSGSNNGGVAVLAMGGTPGVVTSTGGAVTVIGSGSAAATGSSNIGVLVSGEDSRIVATGSTVNITGTAGATGAATGQNNIGVQVQGTGVGTEAFVTSATGTTIVGFGGAGKAAGNADGVNLQYALVDVTGAGNLSITGTALNSASTKGSGNDGVSVDASTLTVGNGNMTLVGTAPGAAANQAANQNNGVSISGASSLLNTSAAGQINISGAGGAAATGNNNSGVIVLGNSQVTASNATTVTISGQGGTGADNNYGVGIGSSTVTSGSGLITILGTANGTGNRNVGVVIADAAWPGVSTPATVGSATGAVTITGTGSQAAAGNANYGIGIIGANTAVTAGTTLTLVGQGGHTTSAAGGTDNVGVGLIGADALNRATLSAGGNLSITGLGGGGSGDADGVRLIDGRVMVAGTGNLTVIGTGLATANIAGSNNEGVEITRTLVEMAATGGNIQVTGTAPSTGALTNTSTGVSITDSSITSASVTGKTVGITGTGAAAATGGNNRGVDVVGSTIDTSTGGAMVHITGLGGTGTGNNNDGVRILHQGGTVASVITGGTGDIGITGNAGGAGSGGRGVAIIGQGVYNVLDTDGKIDITGLASATGTGANNMGVLVTTSSLSSAGAMAIAGTGAATGGNNNHGVQLNDAVASVSGASSMTITGLGGSTGLNKASQGVRVDASMLNAATGDIVITGIAGATGTTAYGVLFTNASTATSTGGDICIDGTSAVATTPAILIGDVGASVLSAPVGTIGLVAHVGGIQLGSGTGSAAVNSSGSLTFASDNGVAQYSGSVTSTTGGLLLVGSGQFLLDSATNDITTLAADIGDSATAKGTLVLQDVGGFTIDSVTGCVSCTLPLGTVTRTGVTVGGTVGAASGGFIRSVAAGGNNLLDAVTQGSAINETNNNVTVFNVTGAGSTVTQSATAGVVTGGLILTGAAQYTLDSNALNDADVLAASTTGAGVSFRDLDSLTVATVAASFAAPAINYSVSGATAAGAIVLTATTAVDSSIQIRDAVVTNGGAFTVNANRHIALLNGADVTTTGGAVNFNADMDAATNAGGAVYVASGSTINTGGGTLFIGSGSATNGNRALGVATTEQSDGVLVDAAHLNGNLGSGVTVAGVITTGAGNVTIKGQAQTGGSSVSGVRITGTAGEGTITTTDGSITITGVADGVTADGSGVLIEGGAFVTADAGNVTITGLGGTGNAIGVIVTGANTTVQSNVSGSLSITGTGGAAGANNVGVAIIEGGTVYTAGGLLAVTGQGGAGGSGDSEGIVVDGGLVNSMNGDVQLQGTSTDGSRDVLIGNADATYNTQISSGKGSVLIRGTATDGGITLGDTAAGKQVTIQAATTVTLRSENGVTELVDGTTVQIAAPTLRLMGKGFFDLDSAGNAVDVLAAEVADNGATKGQVQLSDQGGLVIGTATSIDSFQGVATSTTNGATVTSNGTTTGTLDNANTLRISIGGDLTQQAAMNVVAGGLGVISTGGGVFLDNTGNNVMNLAIDVTAAAGAEVAFRDGTGGYTVKTVDDVAGGVQTKDGDVILRADASGNITLNGPVSTGAGNIAITTAGTVTQNGTGLITTTGGLLLNGGGNFYLLEANNVATLSAADVAQVAFKTKGDLVIDDVTVDVSVSKLPLTTSETSKNGVGINATGAFNGAAVTIIAGGTLDVNNSVDSTTGDIFLQSAGTMTLDATVTAAANNVGLLSTTGDIVQTANGQITTNSLVADSMMGQVDLTAAGNEVTLLAGRAATQFAFREDNGGFEVGTGSVSYFSAGTPVTASFSTGGLTATDAVALIVNDGGSSITQATGKANAIVTDILQLRGSSTTDFTLANSSNAIATLSANTGSLHVVSSTALVLDETALTYTEGSGTLTEAIVTTGGNAVVEAGGDVTINAEVDTGTGNFAIRTTGGSKVTQDTDGGITAGGLQLLSSGTGGIIVDLTTATNDVATIAGSTAETKYVDASGLEVGSVTTVLGTTNGFTTTAGSDLMLHAAGDVLVTQAISGGADVAINAGKGDITFNSTVTATGDVGLSTSGKVTQLAKGAGITAAGLAIEGGADVALLGAGNDVVTIAANQVAVIGYRDTNGFAVGAVEVNNLEAGTFAKVTVDGIDSLGEAYLAGKGNISILSAVSAVGDVVIDATAGNIAIKAAVTATGNDIGLLTSGAISQTAAGVLTANGLLVGGGAANTLAGPTADLSAAANVINVVVAKAQSLSVQAAGAVNVGSVTVSTANTDALAAPITINGIASKGAVNVVAGGDVTQTQTITAPSLTVTSTGGVLLGTLGNDVDTFSATAKSVAFNDIDGLNLGNVTATAGDITLTANGNVTQTGTLATTGGDLSITTPTGNVTLEGANNIDGLVSIVAKAGDIVYNEVGNLMIGYAAGQKVTFIAGGDITDDQDGIGEAVVDATVSITLDAGGIILTDKSSQPFTGFNTPILYAEADGVQANGKAIDVYGNVGNYTILLTEIPKGSVWLNGMQVFPPVNIGAVTAALQSDFNSTGDISMMPPVSTADLYSTDDFTTGSVRESMENTPAPAVGPDGTSVHINNGGMRLPAGLPPMQVSMLVPGGAPLNLPNGTVAAMESNGDVVITLPGGGLDGFPGSGALAVAGGLSVVTITPAGIVSGTDGNGLPMAVEGGIAGNPALRGLLEQIADFLPDEYKRRWGLTRRTAAVESDTKISLR